MRSVTDGALAPIAPGAVMASGLAAAAQRELLLAVEALPCVGVLALRPRHPVVPAAAGAGDALALARLHGGGFGRGHGDPPGSRAEEYSGAVARGEPAAAPAAAVSSCAGRGASTR